MLCRGDPYIKWVSLPSRPGRNDAGIKNPRIEPRISLVSQTAAVSVGKLLPAAPMALLIPVLTFLDQRLLCHYYYGVWSALFKY